MSQLQRKDQSGRVKIMFFPGCLVISIVLSVVGTILLNVLLRAFD
jgi:uncharacterized membrane protein YfhO